jgi:L-lactate dehydrogenase complex protein LldF
MSSAEQSAANSATHSTTHSAANSPAQEFLRNAILKSADLDHRAIIQRGMESYDLAVAKGKLRFADWEAARTRCAAIKAEGIANLAQYLTEFEQRIVARGGHVHWAENADQANDYVVELARARNVKTVVKSKSMVTEEIHLAAALEKIGVAVWESDLGEFIVQLRNEPPYHIVTPAMHLTRRQIADLFRDKLGEDVEDADPVRLVAAARVALRRVFFSAGMGISGANFLVADSGMVAISTNEGNGRLTTSIPRIHVVVTGIEKIIPRMSDLATLWPVLATSGTGQPITTYSTMIVGPRAPGEPDGPEEFHVVLVDNGRTALLADPETEEVLQCIRCGACLNICPIFRQVGGHTYGTTYPGPIGSIYTPRTAGLGKWGHLSYACSLCTACKGVCPVKIDLPRQLLITRRDFVAAGNIKPAERVGFAGFRWAAARASRFRLLGWMGRKALAIINALGLSGTALDPMRVWTKYRSPMALPRQSFRQWWRKNGSL